MNTPDFSHPLSPTEIEERRQWVIEFAKARDELCIKHGIAPHEYQPKTATTAEKDQDHGRQDPNQDH
jgi:hypothetical protein